LAATRASPNLAKAKMQTRQFNTNISASSKGEKLLMGYVQNGVRIDAEVFVGDFREGYRFGFNGQEKDNEIKGSGNSLDFGARIYDSRLGRWLSLDPLQEKYPSLSPYNFTANNPILYTDPDGKRIVIVHSQGFLGLAKKEFEWTPGAVAPSNAPQEIKDAFEGMQAFYDLDNGTVQDYVNHPKIAKVHTSSISNNGSKIVWNPRKAPIGTAAFRVLSHELRHFWQNATNKKFKKMTDEDKEKYGHPAEQDAIEEENKLNQKARDEGKDPKAEDRETHKVKSTWVDTNSSTEVPTENKDEKKIDEKKDETK
jgi:RHS repeat-associated protein